MNNKFQLLILGFMAICLIAISAMFYIMWGKISSFNTHPNKKESSTSEHGAKLGPLFPLDPFIVNIDDPRYKKYLRLTLQLELDDPNSTETINNRLPIIRDAILKILPPKKFQEIISAEGKDNLRNEIIIILNTLFKKKIVANIYFTEFVIQ